ncbi:hypothetical protein JHW43_007447 [Diplocarpon mali]|nr:hypothetical protein JHW43_007447 [Diplocarpon mali]
MNFSNDSLSSVLRTIRTFVTNACTVDTALACPALACPAFELRLVFDPRHTVIAAADAEIEGYISHLLIKGPALHSQHHQAVFFFFHYFTHTAVYSCNWTPSKPLLSAILLITASRPDKHFLPLLLIHPFTSPFPRTPAAALDSSTHTRSTLLQQRNPRGIPRYPALPQAHLAVELPLPNSARQHHVRIHTSRISMRSLPLHREGMVHPVRKDTQALPPCRGRCRVQAIVASQPSPAGCPNTILSRVVGGRAGEFELEEAARPHGGELLGGEGEESSRENKTIGTVRRVGPDTYSAHLLGDGVGSFGILRAGIQASVGEGILELDMGIAWDVVEEEAAPAQDLISPRPSKWIVRRQRVIVTRVLPPTRILRPGGIDWNAWLASRKPNPWGSARCAAVSCKPTRDHGQGSPEVPRRGSPVTCNERVVGHGLQRIAAAGSRGRYRLIPPQGVAHLMSPLPAAAQPILAGREGVTSRKRRRRESLARASGGVDAPGHRTKRAATASCGGHESPAPDNTRGDDPATALTGEMLMCCVVSRLSSLVLRRRRTRSMLFFFPPSPPPFSRPHETKLATPHTPFPPARTYKQTTLSGLSQSPPPRTTANLARTAHRWEVCAVDRETHTAQIPGAGWHDACAKASGISSPHLAAPHRTAPHSSLGEEHRQQPQSTVCMHRGWLERAERRRGRDATRI